LRVWLNSTTTAQEVIRALLSKFKITDNPLKFALYEKNLGNRKTGRTNCLLVLEHLSSIAVKYSDLKCL